MTSTFGEDEFRAVVRELSQPLLSFASSIVRDADAAHDVVQVAMLRVWKRRRQWQAESARAYCYRAVRNEALSFIRNRRLRNRHEQEASRMAETNHNPASSTTAREAWQAALDLPAELREPLVLHYGHGLTVTEVADALDAPRGTIATRLRRALETLRGSLLAVPAFAAVEPEGLEGTLRNGSEFASDVHVSNQLVASLEAAVMAGIATKGAWSAGTIVALVLVGLIAAGGAVLAFADWGDESSAAQVAVLNHEEFDPQDRVVGNQNLEPDHSEAAGKEAAESSESTNDPEPLKSELTTVPDIDAGPKVPALGPITVKLSGVVIESSGLGVAHADVVFTAISDARSMAGGELVATVKSDAEGRFEATFQLAPVDPRKASSALLIRPWASAYRLSGSSDGFVLVRWYAGEDSFARDGLMLRVSEVRRTQVHVTDTEGSPIAGARVWWRQQPGLADFGPDSNGPERTPDGKVLEFFTETDGVAAIEVPKSNELQGVQVFQDGYVSVYQTVVTKNRNDSRPIEVQLHKARPSLRVEVQDIEGRPLSHKSAYVGCSVGENQYFTESQLRSTMKTDAAGAITLDSAPVGEIGLIVGVEGRSSEFVTVSEATDHVVVKLKRWNTLTLSFVDERGTPLEIEDEHLRTLAASFGSQRRSSEGKIVMEWEGEIDEVDIDITFCGWTNVVPFHATLEDGSAQTFIVPAPEDSDEVRVQVLEHDGRPASGAEVYYSQTKLDLDDLPYNCVHTDAAGRFTFYLKDMPSVWICASRRGVFSEVRHVKIADADEIKLTLAQTSTLKVTLSDTLAASRPLLIARDTQGVEVGRWVASGVPTNEVEIERLPLGAATVTVMTEYSRLAPFAADPYTFDVEIAADSPNHLDLSTVVVADISVRILIGDQPPLPDVYKILLWVRMGAEDDPRDWGSLKRVLDIDSAPVLPLDAEGRASVAMLPGRYLVLFADMMNGGSWGAIVDVTDRTAQQLDISLVKLD
ncbi:MAG: sigma-70 family RNA polymerase sigma factor [Planctomycetota bacterium]